VLPKTFADAMGKPPTSDRAADAIAATTAALGEGIGRLYVERYFPPKQSRGHRMVENIRTVFRTRIANLTWMSPATKEKALAKLAALIVGLGAPERWIDYSSLAIVRGEALGNMRRAKRSRIRASWQAASAGRSGGMDQPAPTSVGRRHPLFESQHDAILAGILQPPTSTSRRCGLELRLCRRRPRSRGQSQLR